MPEIDKENDINSEMLKALCLQMKVIFEYMIEVGESIENINQKFEELNRKFLSISERK